jgi:hypothetical protein
MVTITNPAPLGMSLTVGKVKQCDSCRGTYQVACVDGVNGDPFIHAHICAGCMWLQRLNNDLARRLGARKARHPDGGLPEVRSLPCRFPWEGSEQDERRQGWMPGTRLQMGETGITKGGIAVPNKKSRATKVPPRSGRLGAVPERRKRLAEERMKRGRK